MTLNTLPAGLALAALIASLPAAAATAVFDFENLPIATETPFTMSHGGITAQFAGPPSVDPGAFGISSNFPSPTGFAYRTLVGDFLTVGGAFGATGSALTITFSTLLDSLSFDFALDDPSNTTILSFATSAGGTGDSPGALSKGFRYPEGVVTFSGAPFDAITIQSTAIDFQIDNLAVTAAVPEPATAGLLAAGLGVLAFLARARRRDRRGDR